MLVRHECDRHLYGNIFSCTKGFISIHTLKSPQEKTQSIECVIEVCLFCFAFDQVKF